MPKASILIPFRNAEKYLKACLESIQAQTDTDWEVILIDDHSEDSGRNIAEDFCEKDTRFQVSTNKGKGIISGLRTAYEKSSGELITRMDADDIMMNEKISELKQILIKENRGVVATGLVKYFSDDELGNGYERYENWLNQLLKDQTGYQEIYKECVVPSPCWMLWREDLDLVGAFDSDVYPEDYDLCFRFYKQGLRVVSSLKTLHHWRDYPERTSRNDPRLKDQSFMRLKLARFLELEMLAGDEVAIWGAGKKGKLLARLLREKKTEFSWVSDNPRKHGKSIYDTCIESSTVLKNKTKVKVLVAVTQRGMQQEIGDCLESYKFKQGEDYYFFC
jgi:glycosyltransferase involved in cell wall biosynthesis